MSYTSSTVSQAIARADFIDTARAIGIVLVVIGHAPGVPSWLTQLIYSFHMPLFFLLSGYVVKAARMSESWRDWLQRTSRSLLLPYIIFFVLSWLYWLLASIPRGGLPGTTDLLQPWFGLLYGSSSTLTVNVVLWFFPALMLTAFTGRLLARHLKLEPMLLLTLAGALLWVLLLPLPGVRAPWSADCLPVALFFYTLGRWLAHSTRSGPWSTEQLFLPKLLPAYLLIWLGISLLNGRVDLNGLTWGRWPVLYLPGALAGIMVCLTLARWLPALSLTRWLAGNSLFIFPLHPLFFSVLTGFGMLVLKLPESFKNSSSWVSLTYVLSALLLSWPAAILARRSLPGLFGHR